MGKGIEDQTIAATQPAAAASPEAGAALPDLCGRTLGPYQVLRRLGQGGMGQVYLAEQTSLRRRVALKILKGELAADPNSLRRFQQEAHAVARATHANIVQVYDVGSADGFHFMALEYVEGRNLRDYLARKGPPDVPVVLRIMRQVAAALQRAAELGIIHRDIKPENILLTRKGEAKVADFGLSRVLTADPKALHLTQSGVTMGTPLYMSPEQVEGKPLDPRTDVYSFGVTCYHMLAGRPPFKGQNAFEVALHHVRTEPEPLTALRPDVPPELCAVVHKMMAKKPEDRYPNCGDLLLDLGRLCDALDGGASTGLLALTPSLELPAASLGVVTGPQSAVSAGPIPVVPRRRRLWLTATILLALLGGAGAGWLRLKARAKATLPASADVRPVNPLVSESERLEFLQTAVKEYWDRTDQQGNNLCVAHSVELVLFHLDRWHLDDAAAFAKRLQAHVQAQKAPRYQWLGRLTEAIVLALKDEPAGSNDLFERLLEKAKPAEQQRIVTFVNLNPKLRLWVVRALDHNCENAPEKFPKSLQKFREPPAVAPRRPADKPLQRG